MGCLFFLIGFDFFIVYFLSHIVKKKIVLENSLVIKLYKITKIKGCGKLWIIIVTYNVLFFYDFFFKIIFIDLIFKIKMIKNLAL